MAQAFFHHTFFCGLAAHSCVIFYCHVIGGVLQTIVRIVWVNIIKTYKRKYICMYIQYSNNAVVLIDYALHILIRLTYHLKNSQSYLLIMNEMVGRGRRNNECEYLYKNLFINVCNRINWKGINQFWSSSQEISEHVKWAPKHEY